MIRYFRNFRKRVLEEGKVGKYLKYAIGEIILVVIGILIALSINNWNNERIKRQAALKFYQNLNEQITRDSLDILGQIRFNAYYRRQYQKGIEIIENNDKSLIDSLKIVVKGMTEYSDFDRRGNIYENTVNSGDIKLIQNDDIIKGILQLEENLMYMNRMESIHYEAMMNYAIPMIQDLIKFNTGEIKKPEKLYGYEFQNSLVLFDDITAEKDMVYRNTLNTIGQLKTMLKEELNKEK